MFHCAQTRENSLFGLEVLNYVTLNFFWIFCLTTLTFTLDQVLLAVQDKADESNLHKSISYMTLSYMTLEVYRLFHCGLEFFPLPI